MKNPSRRDLLKSAAAAPFAIGSAGALRWLPGGDDRCLVVLELEGGNDGLNTLIPVDFDAYARARPDIGEVRKGAHRLGDGYALHPGMSAMARLVKEGTCTVIHGVGYPDPDRSHFRSRDIWHTADPGFTRREAGTSGWLGRAADLLADRGAAVPGLSVGSLGLPLALRSKRVVVPSLERIEDYQVLVDPAGGKEAVRRDAIVSLIEGGNRSGSGLDRFLKDVARSAVDGAERMREALHRYSPKAKYPATSLGRRLQLLARELVSGFGTRLFHLGFGGFDTHARQQPTHTALLSLLSNAVAAFVADLQGHGLLDRTIILIHSEFGRRVAQNKSMGTDHGAAAPVFMLGGGVDPGLSGKPPSLMDLLDGDLRPTCDFRELYGASLRRLGIDEKPVLGRAWKGLDPFS